MKLVSVVVGGVLGAAAGFAAGVLLAPRSGAESRAMASDAMNDAWDSAVDKYERSQQAVADKVSTVRPNVDGATDDLRAKVDLARERMDQLRDSLSETVANTSAQVTDAVSSDSVTDPNQEECSGCKNGGNVQVCCCAAVFQDVV